MTAGHVRGALAPQEYAYSRSVRRDAASAHTCFPEVYLRVQKAAFGRRVRFHRRPLHESTTHGTVRVVGCGTDVSTAAPLGENSRRANAPSGSDIPHRHGASAARSETCTGRGRSGYHRQPERDLYQAIGHPSDRGSALGLHSQRPLGGSPEIRQRTPLRAEARRARLPTTTLPPRSCRNHPPTAERDLGLAVKQASPTGYERGTCPEAHPRNLTGACTASSFALGRGCRSATRHVFWTERVSSTLPSDIMSVMCGPCIVHWMGCLEAPESADRPGLSSAVGGGRTAPSPIRLPPFPPHALVHEAGLEAEEQETSAVITPLPLLAVRAFL